MTVTGERRTIDGVSSTLGEYHDFTGSILMVDDPTAPDKTIQGWPIEPYLYVGLQDEVAELTGRPGLDGEQPNLFDPAYNRTAVLQLPVEQTAEYLAMTADVRAHAKEMGDVLWYVTRTMAAFGQRIDSAFHMYTSAGFVYPLEDTFANVDELARHHHGLIAAVRTNALEAFDNLYEPYRAACESAMRYGGGRYSVINLRATAPPLILSLAAIAQERFGTTLSEVASENRRKLLARISTNTIFGNGDFREEQTPEQQAK